MQIKPAAGDWFPDSMSGYAAAPKKTTSVSVAEPLLAEAKALGVNVSQAAEEGLARAVATKRAELWLRENREAIQSSNDYVEEHGLPLARYRMF
jgi:antitoxin CcdA